MHRINTPLRNLQPRAGDAAGRRRFGGACVGTCLVLGLVMLAGCDSRPQRVSVSGQVLIDGEPLTFGSVRFIPKNARPSIGDLDDTGHFQLSCFDAADGVVLGQHQVEVSAVERMNNSTIHWHAPKKYANYTTSGLSETITEPTDSLVINLSWGGGKPFSEESILD